MTTTKSRQHVYSSVALCALFALAACGGGGGGDEQEPSRSAATLELKTWAPWNPSDNSISSQYDANSKTATLSHDDPETKIAYSQHTIRMVGNYRVQLNAAQGIDRAQLIPVNDQQKVMEFAAPAQTWIDVHTTFPVDIEFAPGTEYLKVRVMFKGEVTVGTFSMIPLDENGVPLRDSTDGDDQPDKDSSSPTF